MKVCTKCGDSKPLERFDRAGTSGRILRRCRDCINAARRDRRARNGPPPSESWERRRDYQLSYAARNREKVLDAQRRSKYGLKRGEYERLRAIQDGCCAVCKQPTETLQVDHDHDTGRVRGLLCGHCNKALGLFRDDPDRLLAAVVYLKPVRSLEAI